MPRSDQKKPFLPPRSWHTATLVLAMLAAMWFWQSTKAGDANPVVPYSTLFTWVEQGKLKAVSLEGSTITGELKAAETMDGRRVERFRSLAPAGDQALLPVLRSKGVRIEVKSEQQPFAVQVIVAVLPWALIIGVWFWLSRRAQSALTAGGGPFGNLVKGHAHRFEKSTAVDVTFADIAGLKPAKQDLQEVVQFLREPERFRRVGGKAPRGILLVGPPGTGKTLLARAVAGESGVPFFSITASEFVEMFVGLGAARVRDLFEEAKKSAPSIIFIDEIDAVGRSRAVGLGVGHDEQEQTLNQLLAAMDGFDRSDQVVVLAATNRPDILDPALLRPGRFDRRVVVDRPELAARQAILQVHAKGKPLAADVDLLAVAQETPGFSGADLANLVNEAALAATRRGGDTITAADFTGAYEKIVLGDPREGKLDAREKRRVAYHEAGHALGAHFSSEAEPPRRITIIPRGLALGATQQAPGEDRHLLTQPELAARLRVLMGGYAAERLVLGDVSTGAEDDLRQATELALRMVAHFGMSEALGPMYYDYRAEHPFLGQRVGSEGGTSSATVSAIEAEARALLVRALDESAAILRDHRDELERLVALLLQRETVEREELLALLGPSPQRAAKAA